MNDTTLEELLSAAGGRYEVPGDAFARVLEAAGESAGEAAGPVRRRFEHPRLAAAAVLLVAAVVGTLLWSGDSASRSSLTASLPPAVDFQGSPGKLPGAPVVDSKGHLSTNHSTPDGAASRALVNGGAPDAGGLTSEKVLPGPAGDLVGSAAGPGTDGAKIVHTGTLSLSVAKGQVSPTLTRVTALATGVGGYVSSSTTAESGSRPSGTIVLRVPAAEYDTVLTQARTLGTVVTTTSTAQDVTAQATDQQARLTALKASRDQFLTILAKAKTIGETLAVQQRVDDAQTQIDQLQGQINVLSSQASYGTLTVTVSQKSAAVVAAKPVHRQSGLSKAWHSAVTGFVTGVEALIARSGRGLLVVLVLLAVAGVLRGAWRVSRRRLV